MKKVGIMGGTFNPIHYGHLFLAENSFDQLGLNTVLFMPSKNPPHKFIPGGITQEQRVEMISRAIKNNPHFELSLMELDREGITYTADTLTLLTDENKDTEYYFIVGADSLMKLQTWKSPQIICDLCTIIAADRDDMGKEQLNKQIELLKSSYNARIKLIDMPAVGISSSDIRYRIAARKSIRYYVPDAVNEYITNEKLYIN
jgi:nicotinate-nucleotide adenylyltransferase